MVPQTLKDYLEQWLERQAMTLKEVTFSGYWRHIHKHVLPYLGHMQLKKVTSDVLERYYIRLQQAGLRASSFRYIHRILSSAFNDGIKRKLLASNPCKLATVPRLQLHDMHVISLEQAQRLLAAAKGHSLEVVLTLALATGMRRGEVLALRWSDIDFEKDTLHVKHTLSYIATPSGKYTYVESEPKTACSRRGIALPPFVMEALKHHRVRQTEARLRAETWTNHDLVFCTAHGTYYNPFLLTTQFKKLLIDAGLPAMRFHDLRHSAATIMLTMGVHPKIVQEILGHSNISITLNTYSHVLPSLQREAMNTLGSAFALSM
jgi:integrase